MKKKVTAGILTVCLGVSAFLAGTFAWQVVSNGKGLYGYRAEERDPGANLHDNFNSETGEKQVYVENTGDTNIYVRIRLKEMYAEGTSEEPEDAKWHLHIPVDDDPAKCAGEEGYHAKYGDAFQWMMGNKAELLYTSITETDEWRNAGGSNREEIRTAWDKLVADSLGDTVTVQKADTSKGGGSECLPTFIPKCSVMTMEEWGDIVYIPEEGPPPCWVYDADGYAYWYCPLLPGQTTGLLLNKVVFPEPGSETYCYGVDVEMEYVDEEDLPAWTEGEIIQSGSQKGQTTQEATPEAKELLRGVQRLEAIDAPENLMVNSIPVRATAKAPVIQDARFHYSVKIKSWESSDESIISVDENGDLTAHTSGRVVITGTSSSGSRVDYTVTAWYNCGGIDGEAGHSVIPFEWDWLNIRNENGSIPAPETLIWTSEDEEIALIDVEAGVIRVSTGAPGGVFFRGMDEENGVYVAISLGLFSIEI